MNTISSSKEARQLVARLAKMEIVARYQEAFEKTSGCRFRLVAEEDHHDNELGAYDFLREVCVPVEMNLRVVAHLCAEPLRIADGKQSTFEEIAAQMLEDGCTAAELRTARGFFQTATVVSEARAEGLTTLLEIFAEQLGDVAEKLFLQTVDCEPESVRRARKYIMDNLSESLSLEDVADEAGVSPFHFCKIFKRATGLTFTNFVNGARVEKAKRLLLKPQARVTEVAYDVGFQSLSQFNRSFRRIVSLSPTEYRCSLHKEAPGHSIVGAAA